MQGNPKTDPVALWLNGGPGSSSLIGFFTENGPFMTNDRSLTENTTAVPKLFHRETGWQKAASYIFLESPAGVGFSYCDYDNCTASDTSTAMDNHNVLKGFFKGFPEFAKNPFYITGESYAGVYCPTLAEQIMNDAANEINLQGLAVGNGCWGSKVSRAKCLVWVRRCNTRTPDTLCLAHIPRLCAAYISVGSTCSGRKIFMPGCAGGTLRVRRRHGPHQHAGNLRTNHSIVVWHGVTGTVRGPGKPFRWFRRWLLIRTYAVTLICSSSTATGPSPRMPTTASSRPAVRDSSPPHRSPTYPQYPLPPHFRAFTPGLQ